MPGMDPIAPPPRPATAAADAGDWQVFFVRAVDPLEPDAHSPVAALRRAGVDALSLRVSELRGEAAETLAAPLAQARHIDRWLFSSPAAMRHLQRIDRATGGDLFGPGGILASRATSGCVFAPGPGTAEALASAGIAPVTVPAHGFDSEGLLALPALAAPLTGGIAIVTAPGGRGLLQETLAARGARVLSLHVYRREPAQPGPLELARLRASARPLLVATSSAALRRLPQALPGELFAQLRAQAPLVVASARIAAQAQELGFRDCRVAGSAMPDDLLATVRQVVGPERDAAGAPAPAP